MTTLLVTHWHDRTARPAIAHFDDMASLVSISAVIYGMLAVTAELGGRVMFWALAQRQKEKDAAVKARREMRAKAKSEGRARGLAEGLAAGRAAGQAEGKEEGRIEGLAAGQVEIIADMWRAAQSDEERGYIRRIAEARGVALPPK